VTYFEKVDRSKCSLVSAEQFGLESFDLEALDRLTAERLVAGSTMS
jgi:hypothetical protein